MSSPFHTSKVSSLKTFPASFQKIFSLFFVWRDSLIWVVLILIDSLTINYWSLLSLRYLETEDITKSSSSLFFSKLKQFMWIFIRNSLTSVLSLNERTFLMTFIFINNWSSYEWAPKISSFTLSSNKKSIWSIISFINFYFSSSLILRLCFYRFPFNSIDLLSLDLILSNWFVLSLTIDTWELSMCNFLGSSNKLYLLIVFSLSSKSINNYCLEIISWQARILFFIFSISSRDICLISSNLFMSAFSKYLNFLWRSLYYLVIFLEFSVSFLLFFLNSKSFAINSSFFFFKRFKKNLSFFFSTALKAVFSSSLAVRTLKL